MKILHTGDWHLGKLVHGIHMTPDQGYVLEQLIQLIEEEKPDVLIVAGDVYDRAVPPIEAVELLDATLSAIILQHRTKVIVIAGNHDSPDRVGFASKLLRDNGLYIIGNLTKNMEPVIIEDEFGPVYFYPIPFVEPALIKELYDDESVKNHDAAMAAIQRDIRQSIDASQRNVCIAHAFVLGSDSLVTSESERPLSIGGSEYVSLEYFEGFQYVALGHLHGPQKVKHPHIRYAGSLLKYSFSEAIQKKSVVLATMDGAGKVEIELRELKPLRDMRVVRGKLENLLDKDIYAAADTEDYIMALLTDRGEVVDAISQLRAVYPNILRLEREQFEREAGTGQVAAGSEFFRKKPLDLFAEFYENVSGETFTEVKKDLVADLFDEVAQSGRVS
jgi:exonuclease SbcD